MLRAARALPLPGVPAALVGDAPTLVAVKVGGVRHLLLPLPPPHPAAGEAVCCLV
jgi:hypothetical protein